MNALIILLIVYVGGVACFALTMAAWSLLNWGTRERHWFSCFKVALVWPLYLIWLFYDQWGFK